jgi:dihydroneopterin aldolase
MPDRIILQGLAVEAVVGVYPHERHARRPLRVDVVMSCDLSPAGASDSLADTVDYDGLSARVRRRCAETSYHLLEALAGDIARVCLEEQRVRAVQVTVHKPGAVPGVGDVAVTIERGR